MSFLFDVFILQSGVARKAVEIALDHVFAVLLHPFPTLFRDDFKIVHGAAHVKNFIVEGNLRGSTVEVAEGSDWPLVAVGVHTVFNAKENAEVGAGSDWQGEKFVVRHAQRIHRERTFRKLSFALSKEKITAHFLLLLDKL
jgi:hypothetical protein